MSVYRVLTTLEGQTKSALVCICQLQTHLVSKILLLITETFLAELAPVQSMLAKKSSHFYSNFPILYKAYGLAS